MNKVPPISDTTWDQLVVANRSAVQAGWAQKGVFATGIGNGYWENPKRLLYVGKSLGPLAHLVGMDYDRAKSAEASRKWMETQRNGGARFWQFVEQFDQNRQGLAWANISKID